MKHVSDGIAGQFGKLNPDIAAKIKRCADGAGSPNVAGANTSPSILNTPDIMPGITPPSPEVTMPTPKGASRRLPMIDLPKKVKPSHTDPRPSPLAPSTNLTTKPMRGSWPSPTPFRAESGKARAGRLGSMPSSKSPSR